VELKLSFSPSAFCFNSIRRNEEAEGGLFHRIVQPQDGNNALFSCVWTFGAKVLSPIPPMMPVTCICPTASSAHEEMFTLSAKVTACLVRGFPMTFASLESIVAACSRVSTVFGEKLLSPTPETTRIPAFLTPLCGVLCIAYQEIACWTFTHQRSSGVVALGLYYFKIEKVLIEKCSQQGQRTC